MKLSYQTIGFGAIPFGDVAATLAEIGYDAVHLAPWRNHHLEEASTHGVHRVRELARAAGIAIQAVGAQVDPVQGPDFGPNVELAWAIAQDAGVDLIALQPGTLGELDRPAARRKLVENLKPVIDRAAADGLRISIEPVNQYDFDYVVNGLEEFLLVAEALGNPKNFGLHCDLMWLMDGRYIPSLTYDARVDDPLEFLRQFGDRIFDLGIHWLDDIVPFGLSGWQGVYTANDGPKGPWWVESFDACHRQWVNEVGVTCQDLVRTLQEIGFDRPLVMEYENVYHQDPESAVIAARRIHQQARAMLEEATG